MASAPDFLDLIDLASDFTMLKSIGVQMRTLFLFLSAGAFFLTIGCSSSPKSDSRRPSSVSGETAMTGSANSSCEKGNDCPSSVPQYAWNASKKCVEVKSPQNEVLDSYSDALKKCPPLRDYSQVISAYGVDSKSIYRDCLGEYFNSTYGFVRCEGSLCDGQVMLDVTSNELVICKGEVRAGNHPNTIKPIDEKCEGMHFNSSSGFINCHGENCSGQILMEVKTNRVVLCQ